MYIFSGLSLSPRPRLDYLQVVVIIIKRIRLALKILYFSLLSEQIRR